MKLQSIIYHFSHPSLSDIFWNFGTLYDVSGIFVLLCQLLIFLRRTLLLFCFHLLQDWNRDWDMVMRAIWTREVESGKGMKQKKGMNIHTTNKQRRTHALTLTNQNGHFYRVLFFFFPSFVYPLLRYPTLFSYFTSPFSRDIC